MSAPTTTRFNISLLRARPFYPQVAQESSGDRCQGGAPWNHIVPIPGRSQPREPNTPQRAADREWEGQKFTVKYTVKVEGDTLKGKAEVDLGGESRSFDIEGKREKKDK